LLDEAAVAAVWQWRYTPLRMNDTPVPFSMTLTVPFPSDDPADLRLRPSSAIPDPTSKVMRSEPGVSGDVWRGDPRRAGLDPAAHDKSSGATDQRDHRYPPVGHLLYRIQLGPRPGEQQASEPAILVLMDGSIVEPRSELQ